MRSYLIKLERAHLGTIQLSARSVQNRANLGEIDQSRQTMGEHGHNKPNPRQNRAYVSKSMHQYIWLKQGQYVNRPKYQKKVQNYPILVKIMGDLSKR